MIVQALADRSEPNPGKGRGLTIIAVVALVGAGLLAFAGIRATGGGESVLYADDAVASVLPPTVPPLITLQSTDTEPQAVDTELADRDIAEQTVPSTSDYPETTSTLPAPRAEPVGLQIDTIDVSLYPVRSVGLQDNGQLEVPDETEIGWYKYGATAGHPGSTVLAAHVNWKGSQGPFSKLGTVEPGDQIEVALDDGTTRNYEVTERMMYGKLELPKERIWRNTGAEELVLITCGGEFNPEIRSFRSNIVVYAVPVG
jgi:sortase (surface protein transpeptidase)